MNENIDLTKIFKDCPKGWKFYSNVLGEVEFICIASDIYKIKVEAANGEINSFTSKGMYRREFNGECNLFPSKDQRDWSKFTAPWYKKEKFDPKTLKAFDKVLVRDAGYKTWQCNLFSHIVKEEQDFPYVALNKEFRYCIPYNDDTKHLVGTTDEAPEYYRYWED